MTDIRKKMEKYLPLGESYEDAKIIDREILSLLECLKKELEDMCFFLFYKLSLN